MLPDGGRLKEWVVGSGRCCGAGSGASKLLVFCTGGWAFPRLANDRVALILTISSWRRS